MGMPSAKMGDKVIAVDTHVVMIPSPGGPVPTPMPMPFNGTLTSKLSSNVQIERRAAATEGSVADNLPPHVPSGGPFQRPPSNKGTVKRGSQTVQINRRAAARTGDPADTCNDPKDAPKGTLIGSGTVFIGG